MKTKRPVILIIRDGWGYNPRKNKNLIALASTPNEDLYLRKYPHTLIKTSGEAVGLAPGFQGNSEVGHLTLGAGRTVFQSLPRIDHDIRSGEFFRNKVILDLINKCKKNKSALHLIGLLQDQGVHAHLKHLFALLETCRQQKFTNVLIHAITDGRDAPVKESRKHLTALRHQLKTLGFGKIVTVSGRYYSMDRDKRWERIKVAYETLVLGKGPEFMDVLSEVKRKHQAGETDEFIKPARLQGYQGFHPGDGVMFFNFRTDRPRELTQAIINKKFSGFKRKLIPVNFVAMTQYYTPFKAGVAFPNISLDNLLGEVISQKGLKQLRISETEKYAHVTFFFNGQKEKASRGEHRILINSPKVATYDLKPEMSAPQIATRLVKEIKKSSYDFIVTNLVNGDMVGHTGKTKAILKAVEAVDCAQGEIIKAALEKNYTCLVLADHGNAEDKSIKTATSHTTNPVPFILISSDKKLLAKKLRTNGGLKDIAPTVLKIMGLVVPKEMDGVSLLK